MLLSKNFGQCRCFLQYKITLPSVRAVWSLHYLIIVAPHLLWQPSIMSNRAISLISLIKNNETMLIERTSTEVIIRLPASVDITGLQRLVDYLTYKEVTSNSKATQDQVDKLASDVKRGWWKKNRKRLIK